MAGDNPLMNIGDLAKPADTLINKISDAIGVLYEPRRIVKKAKAESEAAEIKAVAELKIDAIKKRTLHRVLNDEAKKQNNIESIIEKSISQISSDAKPNNIDNDWLANMFEKAKIVSNEQMQILWSKLLAGEANNPGSFSRRTISIVSELEMKDAKLFTDLCQFTFMIGVPTIVIFDLENDIYKKNNIEFTRLKHLDTLGLISFENISGYIRKNLPKKFIIGYYGKPIEMTMKNDKENTLSIGSVLLTQSGQELVRICGSAPSDEIFSYTKSKWVEQGIEVK